MATIAGTQADVYATAGASVAFTHVALTDSGDHTTYTISDTTKRYWDDTVALLIETSPDGTTWTTATASSYTPQYVGGKIVFNAAQPAGTQVRASGNAIPVSKVAGGHDWSLTMTTKDVDTSAFGDSWESSVVLLLGATAKVARFWSDPFFFGLLGTRLVLVLYANTSTGARWEGFANLNTTATKTGVSAVAEEDQDFTVTGRLYFSASTS